MNAPQTPRRMPGYRADIDGLRTIAILPVVFFHAGFGFAQGGFVGVDVFFVISGYLITSLVHREMIAGEFSLVRFYERRVRRLLPALFAMLAACAVASAWLLLPQDLRYFGGSLFATTLFASNIFFWLEAGYFDVAAERKPCCTPGRWPSRNSSTCCFRSSCCSCCATCRDGSSQWQVASRSCRCSPASGCCEAPIRLRSTLRRSGPGNSGWGRASH